MKKMFVCLLATVFCVLIAGSACACTSFAVYGSQVFYGMNFDYFPTSLKFILDTQGAVKTFHLAFKIKLPGLEFFAKTGGMNTNGLFGTCQILMPTVEPPAQVRDHDVVIPLFYESFAPLAKVAEIEALMAQKRLIGLPGYSHHLLFADTSRNAVILEPGQDRNFTTRLEKNFIVMTNFPVHDLNGKNYTQAQGMGADRYQSAYEYLKANAADFNIDKGFELLQKTVSKDTGLSTLCSMIFDPARNEIFIVLNGDFKKIWKVSLVHSTIETYSGFHEKVIRGLDSSGLATTDLLIKAFNAAE